MEKMKLTTTRQEIVNKMNFSSIEDILRYYPYRYDIYKDEVLSMSLHNQKVCVEGFIISKIKVEHFNNRVKTSFVIKTKTSEVKVSMFNKFANKYLKDNSSIVILGKYNAFYNEISVSSFFVGTLNGSERITPVYSLPSGIKDYTYSLFVKYAYKFALENSLIREYLPTCFKEKYKLVSLKDALSFIHNPSDENELTQAKRYLKYEELLNFTMIGALKRKYNDSLLKKHSKIINYFKVKELENMSMFVSKDNVQKVINNFLNRNEDIEIIKTKIDTIFNNSIRAYKENLEKMGYTYDEIMKVYDKVVKLNKTRAKLYLMGGIVPYVLLNDRTGRRHESLDLLCDKKDIEQLRELFRKEDLYDPKRDSLTYTVNNIDYGFQVIVDKIKVNIFIFEETDKGITEYTFDCKKKIGRIKSIAAKMNDYIMPYVTSDNKKYTTVSLEFVVADKLLTNREKDKIDIEKVKECNGMSSEKIKKLPLPVVKEVKLIGDNLEFTSTMPRIKLDVPKKKRSNGFINIGTILLLIAIVVAIVLTNR